MDDNYRKYLEKLVIVKVDQRAQKNPSIPYVGRLRSVDLDSIEIGPYATKLTDADLEGIIGLVRDIEEGRDPVNRYHAMLGSSIIFGKRSLVSVEPAEK